MPVACFQGGGRLLEDGILNSAQKNSYLYNKHLIRNSSFTLAEVLITLVIIGIIASLTVPNLLKKYQRAEWKTGFQQGYAIVSEIGKRYIADNDDFYSSEIDSYSQSTVFNNSLSPYIKGKRCTDTKCSKNCDTSLYKTHNGKVSPIWRNGWGSACYLLDSGATLFINGWPYEPSLAWYDYNGAKKPNRLGYDYFVFLFDTNNQVVPVGAPGRSFSYLMCNSSSVEHSDRNGVTCAIKALTDPDYFKNLK